MVFIMVALKYNALTLEAKLDRCRCIGLWCHPSDFLILSKVVLAKHGDTMGKSTKYVAV